MQSENGAKAIPSIPIPGFPDLNFSFSFPDCTYIISTIPEIIKGICPIIHDFCAKFIKIIPNFIKQQVNMIMSMLMGVIGSCSGNEVDPLAKSAEDVILPSLKLSGPGIDADKWLKELIQAIQAAGKLPKI